MTGDLPDYEKKIVIVTIPGDYPAEMQVDLRKIKGVAFKDPTIAACIPVSIEHIIQTNAMQILGVALKSPTIAQCLPTSIENPAIAYDETNNRFYVDIGKISTTDTIDVSSRAARLVGIVYGNLAQLQQRATSLDLYVQLRSGGTEINPQTIRALTTSDAVTVYGSQTQKLLQRASTYELMVQLVSAGVEINPQTIRALTNADVITVEQPDEDALKATVYQAAKDRTISSIDTTATPLQISLTALNGNSAALKTPAGGKALRIKFISLEQSADVDLGYRFAADGTIYYLRITKGLYVSNLIGTNNQGAADAALYLNSSAATNVKGYILYTEV